MFDISWSEAAIVLVLAVLLINPKDLPEILRGAGKLLGKIKRFSKDVMKTLEEAAGEKHIKEFREQMEREQKIIGKLTDLEGNPREVYDVSELDDDSRKRAKND